MIASHRRVAAIIAARRGGGNGYFRGR